MKSLNLFFLICILSVTQISSQILYTDFDPDMELVIPQNLDINYYWIDIDNDGVNDIRISLWYYLVNDEDAFHKWQMETFPSGGSDFCEISNINCLEYGDSLSETEEWTTIYRSMYINEGVFFIMYRKKIDDDYFYGWIRVILENFFYGDCYITGHAFNSVPNELIAAGEGMRLNVTNLTVTDENNCNNASDLEVSFEQPEFNEFIGGYRVFVVKSDSAANFTLDKALSITDNNLFQEVDISYNGIPFFLNENLLDADGASVTNNVNYNVFVLSYGDSINLYSSYLSDPSDTIMLIYKCLQARNIEVEKSYLGGTNYELTCNFDPAINEVGILEYRGFYIPFDSIEFCTENFLESSAYYQAFEPNGTGQFGISNSDSTYDCYGILLRHDIHYVYRLLTYSINTDTMANVLSMHSDDFILETVLGPVDINYIYDIDNNDNASDLEISFNCTSSIGIKEFRVFLVPANDTLTFSYEDANSMGSEYYQIVDVDGLEYIVRLNDMLFDSQGESIVQGALYVAYILSVADSVSFDKNVLSNFSNTIMIDSPSAICAGQTFGEDIFYINCEGLEISFDSLLVLDVNSDGVDDFNLFCYENGDFSYNYNAIIEGINDNKVACYYSNRIDTLINNTLIDSLSLWEKSGVLYHHSYLIYPYQGPSTIYGLWLYKTGYVGFQFKVDSNIYYGWMKIHYGGGITLYEYAYSMPNTNEREELKGSEPSIYPIPASDKIYIDLLEEKLNVNSTANIYSITGNLINTYSLSSSINALDITCLNPGIYLVEVKNNGKNTMRKFVVSR